MIVDGGGRGNALALEHFRDARVKEILVVPGNEAMRSNIINAGLPENIYTTGRNIKTDPTQAKEPLKNPQELLRIAQEYQPDFVEVQQDDALALGTVDLLEANGFKGRVLGPKQSAAEIESNKIEARRFMERNDIPHPEYQAFNSSQHTTAAKYAWHIIKDDDDAFFKANGLCAGKGVFKASSHEEIVAALASLSALGTPAEYFLVERGVKGEEFSYCALVSGTDYKLFKSSQDNKKALIRDKGKNTGGMGAHSSAWITRGLEQRIENEIFRPTIFKLADEGRPFCGILYLGGMIDHKGNPTVIEFNARWGDPEVQVTIPGIDQSDGCATYTELVLGAIEGRLNKLTLKQDNLYRVCVVGATAGYPEQYPKGKQIWINADLVPEGAYFVSAGLKGTNPFYTNGGRLVGAIATGENIYQARTKANQAISCVTVENNMLDYRADIAQRDVERFLKNQIS